MTQALRRVHPYQEGFDAFDPINGIMVANCPYIVGSTDYHDWWDGWGEARDALNYKLGVIS